MDELYLKQSNLDACKIKAYLGKVLEKSPEDLDRLIHHKRSVLDQLPTTILSKPEYDQLDLAQLARDGKASAMDVVVMAIVYAFLQDTLDNIQLCTIAWAKYASQKGFEAPAAHFATICATLTDMLHTFHAQVSPLTMSIHQHVQDTKSQFVEGIYTAVLQHQTHITSSYTNEFLTTI
jgi:hypothetical protein